MLNTRRIHQSGTNVDNPLLMVRILATKEFKFQDTKGVSRLNS